MKLIILTPEGVEAGLAALVRYERSHGPDVITLPPSEYFWNPPSGAPAAPTPQEAFRVRFSGAAIRRAEMMRRMIQKENKTWQDG